MPCHRSGEQERHDTPARLPHLQSAWQTRGRGVQHARRLDAGSRRVVGPRRGRCFAVRVVETAAGRSCHVRHVRFPSLRRAPFASVTAMRRVRVRDPVARDSPGVLLLRLILFLTRGNDLQTLPGRSTSCRTDGCTRSPHTGVLPCSRTVDTGSA